MRDQHITLARGTPLAESEERLYNFLLDSLPPSCRVWRGVRITQTAERRSAEVDLLVLGHYSLYVVEVKSHRGGDLEEFIGNAHHQARQYAHLVAAAIDGGPLGSRPWLEPVVVLLPDPPQQLAASLPFLLSPSALVHAAVSGELPGVPGPPQRTPLDSGVIEDIIRTLENPGPHASRLQRQVELKRLLHRLLAEPARHSSLPDVSSWIITTCFLLLAEARGWAPPQLTPGPVNPLDAFVAAVGLPCIQALFPAETSLSVPSETIARTLFESLEPLVRPTPHDWRSSATAWSELNEIFGSTERRDAYGSVATPPFVSDFLCDHTVKPAMEVFGAGTVHVLDPACGTGTMLCAAFHRLLDSGDDTVFHVLDRVHGIDIDPVAALIARVRLLVAYLERTPAARLDRIPPLPIHVFSADALLSAPPRRYHAVICEPPFVTCKDPAKNQRYRQLFPDSASGKFSLDAPFIERCFQFAEPGGFVGVLTSTVFTRRMFGRRLVEVLLANLDIDQIIDASGAFIPDHGTPSLLLFGRNRPPTSDMITVVWPKKVEPSAPIDPAKGIVWKAITTHHIYPGYDDDWITVNRVPRSRLLRHPMDLSLGPARDILDSLEAASTHRLRAVTHIISIGAMSGADNVFIHRLDYLKRMRIEPQFVRPYVQGNSFRPWGIRTELHALAPELTRIDDAQLAKTVGGRFLGKYRPILEKRVAFDRSNTWWHWLSGNSGALGEHPRFLVASLTRTPHFVLAPLDAIAAKSVLSIEVSSRDDDSRQAILAYLNSTTVRVWLSHISHRRGGDVIEITASSLAQLPLPDAILHPGPARTTLAALARRLHNDAQALAACSPDDVLANWRGTSRSALLGDLADAQATERKILRRMVCAQEDIDWTIYEILRFSTEPGLTPEGSALPEHRPFVWRGSKPPAALDTRLLAAWTRRRDALATSPILRTLETAAYKTRFDRSTDSDIDYDTTLPAARRLQRSAHLEGYRQQLMAAVLARTRQLIEAVFADPAEVRGLSPAEITERLTHSATPRVLLSLFPHSVGDPVQEVARLLAENATPYLSALRYTRSGMAKRAAWQQCWCLPHTNEVLPQFTAQDYPTALIWQHRGKLDQERESFIAYPRAAPDGDTLYGWTGWSTDARAAALWAMYEALRDSGADRTALSPMLAGLHDLTVDFPPLTDADRQSAAIMAEARRLNLSTEELHSSPPLAAGATNP